MKLCKMSKEHLPICGSWPDMNCVVFKNPFDPSRYICFWCCGTHSLEGMRNNMICSQPQLAKDFKNNNIYFEWRRVEYISMRDEEKAKKNKGRRTYIVRHAVTLENYTLTNAIFGNKH